MILFKEDGLKLLEIQNFLDISQKFIETKMEFEKMVGVFLSIESGYTKDIDNIHGWAEAIIDIADKPSLWIIELYDSETLEDVLAVLMTAINKDSSSFENVSIDWIEIYLGFLYLRFKKGEFDVLSLLLKCGEKTDSSNYKIDCSYFYSLLNKLTKKNLSQNKKKSILQEIDSVLQPMAKISINTLPQNFGV
jgi:hypothetical protein